MNSKQNQRTSKDPEILPNLVGAYLLTMETAVFLSQFGPSQNSEMSLAVARLDVRDKLVTLLRAQVGNIGFRSRISIFVGLDYC